MNTSKVFIADDHPLFRCGLRLSLNQKENIQVVGEAENGFSAVEKILDNHPDIALIDVDMPGLSGIGAIRILRKAIPELKILVL
ncbi:MAG: response regulator transcription factor, partial [Candidatus Lokiarchaeota archaeon]